MKIYDKEFIPFIDAGKIQQKVIELGNTISEDYKSKKPLFIGVLNGSFMFAADLFKALHIPAEISFIKVSSYLDLASTGDVKQLLGLNEPIFKRNIILLEDIVDSGKTISTLIETLTDLGPSSIEIATLLLKPDALERKVQVKYVGFEIPNEFVVGYGLDYNGLGRNLNELYQLKPEN